MADNDLSSPAAAEPTDLAQLMEQVGPLIDAVEVREYEPSRWAIAFDEDFGIEVEQLAESGKVVLYTTLGPVPEGDEAATYKLLLNVAAMWRETGGLRMGLDPTDDSVIQIYDFPVAGVKLEDLKVQLRNFAETALHARQVLAAGPGASAEDDGLHFVRV